MKVFLISFNRASNNALECLKFELDRENLLTDNEEEADIFLACGDRIETFDYTLKQFRNNKKIIHLWAGITGTISHDEVYRHSISLMSSIQLCEDEHSLKVIEDLFRAVGRTPNAHLVGNIYTDSIIIDESNIPEEPFKVVLYNPDTTKNNEEQLKEIELIKNKIKGYKYFWIEPNGDKGSENITPYVNNKTLDRRVFFGLLKYCDEFITNSSCQHCEAPLVMDKNKIFNIGNRNDNRSTKVQEETYGLVSRKIIRLLEGLK